MRESPLVEQFEDLGKQKDAARLGMWAFLGSEVLLFAGLFGLYAAYRSLYPREFALAILHNNATIGTVNTFVLLTSSFTVALSVHAVRVQRTRLAALLLGASVVLALVFLALKMTEYAEHFREGIYPGPRYAYHELSGYGVQMFFNLYFLTTGLHAIHVTGGAAVLVYLIFGIRKGRYSHSYDTPVELGALYWHLVDVIWIFLWPCLYLMHD
jgi:cytochrome c oxidase subunit III